MLVHSSTEQYSNDRRTFSRQVFGNVASLLIKQSHIIVLFIVFDEVSFLHCFIVLGGQTGSHVIHIHTHLNYLCYVMIYMYAYIYVYIYIYISDYIEFIAKILLNDVVESINFK